MDFHALTEQQPDVQFQAARISFPKFEQYKEQANKIADYVGSLEVSQENVKEVKQVLAQARKITDGLNRKRIDLRKLILTDFEAFEAQVKELSSIIDEADGKVRAMVKELEENERTRKGEDLKSLWEKRILPYDDVRTYMPDAFDRWLTPKHLNKTTTMKSAEADMVAWLEKTTGDINAVRSMGDTYLAEYLRTNDVAKAIQNVKDTEHFTDIVREAKGEPEEETAVFVITGTQNITLAELLLKTNNINYRRR